MMSFKLKEVLCLLYSIVLFFSGFVLIGFAVVLSYKLFFYHFSFVSSAAVWPFIVIFLIGFVHLLTTWIGIKGPGNEHDFFIMAFVVITAILLVVELSVGIWSMVLRSDVNSTSSELMRRSQIDYIKKHSLSNKETSEWIRLQSKFQCCGINGRDDYEKPPPSCFKCHPLNPVNRTKACIETYQRGCRAPLVNFLERLLLENSILSFLAATMQVIGIVIFVGFYRALKEERATRAANRASRVRQSLGQYRPTRPVSGSNFENNVPENSLPTTST